MNGLQVFQNQNFGQVRTTTIDGEPWFVAADVCNAFGVTNSRNVTARLDADEKDVRIVDTLRGKQAMTVVNEAGLYRMLFTMEPNNAHCIEAAEIAKRIERLHAFKRWITHDVIPSIRKTGMYAVPQSLPEALRLAADLAEKIEEQKPLVLFAEICKASEDTLLIRDFAKVLCKKGYVIGAKRLYKKLRDWRLLYYEDERNKPYQKYVDCGYFEVTEFPYGQDNTHLSLTTRITPAGQQYVIHRLFQETQKALLS
jgi:anti-repressor protein